jgi:hypothetical protein
MVSVADSPSSHGLRDVGVDGDRAGARGCVGDASCHPAVDQPAGGAVGGGEHGYLVDGDFGVALLEVEQPRQPLVDERLLLAVEGDDDEAYCVRRSAGSS